MKYDQYGQAYCSTHELCDLLYKNPEIDLSKFLVTDYVEYNKAVKHFYEDFPQLNAYLPVDYAGIADFDLVNQGRWQMPSDYRDMDIAQYILSLCKTNEELQRVGQELILYQEKDLFNLLRFLKYLVDTLRKNNIVWGVGRGSSVASYVLYLLGVHKIDSMFYDLDVQEFLK